MSCQISAVPDLCCIVTRRLVESVGGVFDPVVSSAIAVFELWSCHESVWCAAVSRHDSDFRTLPCLPFDGFGCRPVWLQLSCLCSAVTAL